MPRQSLQPGITRRDEIKRGLLAMLVAAVCGPILLAAGLPDAFSPVGQRDFESYYYALKVYDAGGNPWEMSEVVKAAGGTAQHFIYPHHVFWFFRLFAFQDVQTAKDAYLAFRLGCVAALLVLWSTWFIRPGARGWFLAFAAVGYNAVICRDLVVGNVSIVEQTAIWFGLYALMRRRLGVFCTLIILAGQFKLLPLCLLGLVLATDHPRKWAYLAGSIAACGLIAVGVYASNPWAARTFAKLAFLVGTMEPGGSIHPGSLALMQEIADRLLHGGELFGLWPQKTVGNAMYGVLVLLVLGLYVHTVRRGTDFRTALFTGLLTYTLLAPRMKDYSYVIALVPTFELVRQTMARPTTGKVVTIAAVLLLGLPGLDMLWQYRPLILAAWAWTSGLCQRTSTTPAPDCCHSLPEGGQE